MLRNGRRRGAAQLTVSERALMIGLSDEVVVVVFVSAGACACAQIQLTQESARLTLLMTISMIVIMNDDDHGDSLAWQFGGTRS